MVASAAVAGASALESASPSGPASAAFVVSSGWTSGRVKTKRTVLGTT